MKLRRSKPQASRHSVRQRRTTDWQPPAAFSYHAQRAERTDNPSRQQPNVVKQRSHLLSVRYYTRRSSAVFIVALAAICLVSIISLSNTPRIVLLGQDSLGFRNAIDYQQAAAKDLSSSVFNRNKLTINTDAASSALQKQFPELSSVSVTLPLIGHRPIFYLQANAPAFVFQAINGNYILDSSGTALIAKDMAPASTAAHLPVLTDQTGLHVQTGQRVLSADSVAFIQTVLANLRAKQVTATALDLPASAAQELDVHVADQPYYIKFNMHDSSGAQQQVGTYLATANNLASQHITPGQYIDVRVLGRAYYL